MQFTVTGWLQVVEGRLQWWGCWLVMCFERSVLPGLQRACVCLVGQEEVLGGPEVEVLWCYKGVGGVVKGEAVRRRCDMGRCLSIDVQQSLHHSRVSALCGTTTRVRV